MAHSCLWPAGWCSSAFPVGKSKEKRGLSGSHADCFLVYLDCFGAALLRCAAACSGGRHVCLVAGASVQNPPVRYPTCVWWAVWPRSTSMCAAKSPSGPRTGAPERRALHRRNRSLRRGRGARHRNAALLQVGVVPLGTALMSSFLPSIPNTRPRSGGVEPRHCHLCAPRWPPFARIWRKRCAISMGWSPWPSMCIRRR